MKQILQNLSSGETVVAEVPEPQTIPGTILINSSCSLVSAGTERMLVDFGKANLIDKARSQPDKVKEVLQKVRSDGIAPTIEAVRAKLDQPLPLGYCNVGVVAGRGGAFQPGQRVASNGPHAGTVRVPFNLCAAIPDNVDDESAAFTVLGAIALQGVRLSQPTLGECFVVMGLGLVGLLTVQILIANGCRVLAIDIDPSRCARATEYGAEVVDLSSGADALASAAVMSRSRGVDGVIITASSKSNDLIHDAATMCRKRGRIVLVGVVGMELSRADFYEKELTFQVSCSYGPGRYDGNYEDKGMDYPIGFVRWTEQRNFEAVLDLMSSGALEVKSLITDRFDISEGSDAYEKLSDRSALGIMLSYSKEGLSRNEEQTSVYLDLRETKNNFDSESAVVAFIGAGNYASRVLMPAFRRAGSTLDTVVTSAGVSAVHHGRKNGFASASTDVKEVFDSTLINTIVVGTRHDTHAQLVLECIQNGKHMYVEKPLCLTMDELTEIQSAYSRVEKKPLLMVGFNRRFAPHIQKIKTLLAEITSPISMSITVNAGAIAPEHWTQDKAVGGGRILGECCHFIDLCRYLVGHTIVDWSRSTLKAPTKDTASVCLEFSDGSIASINYFSNGPKSLPKERLEVFAEGRALVLDDYQTLRGFDWPRFKKSYLWRQDKGQSACVDAFVQAIERGLESPIPLEEILEVSEVSIALGEH